MGGGDDACAPCGCVAVRLYGRWAAKEAVFKCLGPVGDGRPRLAFPDVEVVPTGSGAPEVVLHGPAARHAQEQGVQVRCRPSTPRHVLETSAHADMRVCVRLRRTCN